MAGFREPSLAERQSEADKARKAALERYRALPGPDDPAVIQRQAERQAARAARDAAREVARREKAAREAAEEAARELARRSEAAAREAIAALDAAREMTVQAARKAARDTFHAKPKKLEKRITKSLRRDLMPPDEGNGESHLHD